jgi:hypothetical protein
VARCLTLLQTADFLCRSSSLYYVAEKANGLGLKWQAVSRRDLISSAELSYSSIVACSRSRVVRSS